MTEEQQERRIKYLIALENQWNYLRTANPFDSVRDDLAKLSDWIFSNVHMFGLWNIPVPDKLDELIDALSGLMDRYVIEISNQGIRIYEPERGAYTSPLSFEEALQKLRQESEPSKENYEKVMSFLEDSCESPAALIKDDLREKLKAIRQYVERIETEEG